MGVAGPADGWRRARGRGVHRRAAQISAESGLFSHLHGLFWLVANLAAREPLVVLADDVHWADTASLRWLVFLAERIEDLPVMLVCATRPAEPGADQLLLDTLASSAQVLRPAPLSAAAAAGPRARAAARARPTRSPRPATGPRAATRSCSASCWRS